MLFSLHILPLTHANLSNTHVTSRYDESKRVVLYDAKFDSITEVNPHQQMFTAAVDVTLSWQVSKADAVAYGAYTA